MNLFVKFRKYLNSILPSFFLSKYFIVFCCFAVWLVFFDKYKVFNQFHLKNRVSEMELRKVELNREIKELKIRKDDIEQNEEKYAREQFLMHRPDEDIFIIRKD